MASRKKHRGLETGGGPFVSVPCANPRPSADELVQALDEAYLSVNEGAVLPAWNAAAIVAVLKQLTKAVRAAKEST